MVRIVTVRIPFVLSRFVLFLLNVNSQKDLTPVPMGFYSFESPQKLLIDFSVRLLVGSIFLEMKLYLLKVQFLHHLTQFSYL